MRLGAEHAGASIELRRVRQITNVTFEVELKIRIKVFKSDCSSGEFAGARALTCGGRTGAAIGGIFLIRDRRRSHNTWRGRHGRGFALGVNFGLG